MLTVLKINEHVVKRSSSIKFLGVIVDEHLNWTDYINILENNLSKILGLLYKSKQFLNVIFSMLFHSYLHYGNIAWYSTSMAKLKRLYIKQKQAIKALSMTFEDNSGLKIENLIRKKGILNIYKLHISHVISIMFKVKNNTIPESYENNFEIVHHYHSTRH